MAKLAETPAPPSNQGGSSKMGLIIVAVVCLLAIGAGFALPLFVPLEKLMGKTGEEPRSTGDQKQALVTFGEVVTNVADGRFTRYLKVKIVLVVEASDEKIVTDRMNERNPFLQTWVRGYLADQTLENLHGSLGMNRVRREIRDQFNAMLFPDGSEKIKDVLMPEFYFQ